MFFLFSYDANAKHDINRYDQYLPALLRETITEINTHDLQTRLIYSGHEALDCRFQCHSDEDYIVCVLGYARMPGYSNLLSAAEIKRIFLSGQRYFGGQFLIVVHDKKTEKRTL